MLACVIQTQGGISPGWRARDPAVVHTHRLESTELVRQATLHLALSPILEGRRRSRLAKTALEGESAPVPTFEHLLHVGEDHVLALVVAGRGERVVREQ